MKIEPKPSRKDNQHVVPRIYLKYWKIAKDKNFVYGIDFSNKYKKRVQEFGLNHKVFKERKYYCNPSFSNPYIIEDLLGNEIEPRYDEIMDEVTREINLSFGIREKVIQWLYYSKMRSPIIRNNTARMASFLYNTSLSLNEQSLRGAEKKELVRNETRMAKDVQLNTFAHDGQLESLLTLFIETLNAKHWRILKSIPRFEFLTNDNPGFSPNTNTLFAKDVPFHHVMEMNADSMIFYPLSPSYCLEVAPFVKGTALNVCAMEMEIKYEQAEPELIDFINEGVKYTCSKVVISSTRNILQHLLT